MQKDKVTIDGIEYIRRDLVRKYSPFNPEMNADGFEYVLVKTENNGIWIGYLKGNVKHRTAHLIEAKNLYRYSIGTTLLDIAITGITENTQCDLSIMLQYTDLFDVTQIIPVTEAAKKSLDSI